jgi:hypothetical protein
MGDANDIVDNRDYRWLPVIGEAAKKALIRHDG